MKESIKTNEGSALVLKNGFIVDGSGREKFRGSVIIENGTITGMTRDEPVQGKIIDCSGMVIAPGFIDIHSHGDLSIFREDHNRILKPLVMQGITTFVGGNCGFSACHVPDGQRENVLANIESLNGPLGRGSINWSSPGEFMDRLERRGILLNMATLVGHGSLRIGASGLVNRVLTEEEQGDMERHLAQALEEGCIGMSTGLQYFPGLQSDQSELNGLGAVLKRHGGIFTSHLRSYSHTLDLAVDEVCGVGLENDIPVQISHFYWQPYSRYFGGLTRGLIRFGSALYNRMKVPIPIEKGIIPRIRNVERWREQGVDVRFDQLPTSQGFTDLVAFLPPYVSEGSREAALGRLKETGYRKKVRRDIETVEPDWPHRDNATWSFNYIKMTGWGGLRVMTVKSEKNRWMEGKTFPEIAEELKQHHFDVLCDLLIEEAGQVMVFHTPTFPDDPFVFRSLVPVLTHPLCVPATDTILRSAGRPSHVFYDCFPRFIDYFVTKNSLLTLEDAVRRSTAEPARIMGIKKRGAIAQGYRADITVFNPDTVSSRADFYRPDKHPAGIEHVFINGVPVVTGGEFDDRALPGEVIRGL